MANPQKPKNSDNDIMQQAGNIWEEGKRRRLRVTLPSGRVALDMRLNTAAVIGLVMLFLPGGLGWLIMIGLVAGSFVSKVRIDILRELSEADTTLEAPPDDYPDRDDHTPYT